MKKSFFLASAITMMVSMSSMASASVFADFKDDFNKLVSTFPAHEADGYRDTGCDVLQQVAVEGTNYSNNPTCPDIDGGDYSLPAASNPPSDDDGVGNNDDCEEGVRGHGPKKGHGHK